MPTIDVSEKTKKLLRKVKKREQFKSFDGTVRYLLMKENVKERNIVVQDDTDRIEVPLSLITSKKVRKKLQQEKNKEETTTGKQTGNMSE